MTHPPLALVLLAFSTPTVALADNPKTETISTPAGAITTTTRAVDPLPQQVTPASAAEVQEFGRFARKARDFVAAYLGSQAKPSLESLDEAFRHWQREAKRQFSEQEVINVLGAYLGSKLVADLDMEWVIVKDQQGTDYGVRSRKVEVLAFPFASVDKRVQRSEYDFMVAVFYAINHSWKTGNHKPR